MNYIPLLRSKAGEVAALKNLSPAAKNNCLPLIRLTNAPTTNFAQSLLLAWGNKRFALNGHYNAFQTGSPKTYVKIFNELGNNGATIIPSVRPTSNPSYVEAAVSLVGKFSPGVIVNTKLVELAKVSDWVKAQNWSKADVDLVVSVGDVSGQDPEAYGDYISSRLEKHISDSSKWGSITLSSSAAPKDLSSLPYGRTNLPRYDWLLWMEVSKKVGFPLGYSDYGPVAPDLSDPPGLAMTRATVSVRYTCKKHWIILKGRQITGKNGLPMSAQYVAHAKSLLADLDFNKIAGCWADEQIKNIAAKKINSGNRGTWVALTMNRHFSFVAHALP